METRLLIPFSFCWEMGTAVSGAAEATGSAAPWPWEQETSTLMALRIWSCPTKVRTPFSTWSTCCSIPGRVRAMRWSRRVPGSVPLARTGTRTEGLEEAWGRRTTPRGLAPALGPWLLADNQERALGFKLAHLGGIAKPPARIGRRGWRQVGDSAVDDIGETGASE